MRVTKSTMENVLKWFAYGDTGMSSKFMATYLTTGEGRTAYPHDPDDLNRCLMLIKAVPELREHLDKMSKTCKQWKELVDNWDALESCFINEVGLNWCNGNSAPITYKAMKAMGC